MTDIQQLIEADKELLLSLNGSNSLFWDGFMWTVTDTRTWILAMVVLLYVVFKNNRFSQGVVITLMVGLCVLLADQLASGLCKPFFARFRPTQDPELMYMVQTVNGYRGGLYGFISSHAANTFAVAMFLSLLVRYLPFTCMMFLWALIPSYSRIYLGVHYPGDILCGAIVGLVVGCVIYLLYAYIRRRFFDSPQYISTQYTCSGYIIDDISILHAALILTYLYAVVRGMLVAKNLHF